MNTGQHAQGAQGHTIDGHLVGLQLHTQSRCERSSRFISELINQNNAFLKKMKKKGTKIQLCITWKQSGIMQGKNAKHGRVNSKTITTCIRTQQGQ